jgi:ParB-like chromosome segregation protein Spo0J
LRGPGDEYAASKESDESRGLPVSSSRPSSAANQESKEDPPDRSTFSKSETYTLEIASLRADYSPRRQVDEEHVLRIAQSERPAPPIVVHRQTKKVIDGVHRLRAAALNGRRHIDVVFFDGTEEEAFIRAVEENVTHGLPLPLADRKAAATRIITTQPHLSDRAIAKHTGLSAKTIAMLRRSSVETPELNTRTGVDGRRRPLSGAEGRLRAAEVIERQPDASVRQIARIAGVSVGTAHDVRRRMRRGEDPAPAQRRAGTGQDPGRPPETSVIAPSADLGRPPERRDPGSVGAILRWLSKDPALRHSDPGRELLRLLHTRSMIVVDPHVLIKAVPPHCAKAVAEVARHYAEGWEILARTAEGMTEIVD